MGVVDQLCKTHCVFEVGVNDLLKERGASDAHITPGVQFGVKWCGGGAGGQVEIQYQPHKSCSDALLNLVVEE